MPAPDTPSAVAPVSLGLPGLDDSIAVLARGQVYGIVADPQSLRLPLLARLLHTTLSAGGRCTMILPGDPAAFLSKARLAGFDLVWFEQNGDLELIRQRADPLLPLFRGGPAPVLEMIDRAVRDDRRLLVIEQAEPLLLLSDPDASLVTTDGLRGWAARRGLVVLAAFTPATRPQREFLSLRAVAEDFAGFAVLREHEGGAVLDLRHWFAEAGATPRGSLRLKLQESGGLTVEPAAAVPGRAGDSGLTQVVAIERALDDALGAVRDASWVVIKHHAEAIESARRLAAGAIVLSFDRATPFRALCQAVSSIRRVAAPWVSIVVRERGLRLRLGQQIALTRLGASTVLSGEQDDAGLAQAIRALSGTAFMRALPEDLEATIAAASTPLAPQLMVTRAFRDMVSEVLSASEGIDLPHTLLHVACDPAKAQQLGTLALQRKVRDAAMSVDPSGLWLFLFACPASRARGVAERVFGRIHAEIAPGITAESSIGGIARRLERLAAAVGVREGAAPITPPTPALTPEPADTRES
ncbi:MAG: hypothetical protein EHM87_18995 [Burkholderiales bacterium]|nr:MAG: hypothetical protein EHM87_18995 [Burkholderiales bacterium]